MSTITLRKIIEEEKFLLEYGELIMNIKRETELNDGMYNIYGLLPIHIDSIVTNKLLDTALHCYDDYMEKKDKEKEKEKEPLQKIVQFKEDFYSLREMLVQEMLVKGLETKYKMDEPNKKMMDVLAEKGMDGMIAAISKEMKDEKMSYSEMRHRYG